MEERSAEAPGRGSVTGEAGSTEEVTPIGLQMDIQEIQGLIERAIIAGRQIEMDYTNSNGEAKTYKIAAITNTWDKYFNVVPISPDGKGRVKKFRYDRISRIDITEDTFQPHDMLIEKIRDGSLFSEKDNRVNRSGGIKGYPSSINYILKAKERMTKKQASEILAVIDVIPIPNFKRAIMWNIEDGDTFDVLVEDNSSQIKVCRLFGADTPEYDEQSDDYILGLEAKIFVEDLFKNSRYCHVRELGREAYRRHLIEVCTADGRNVALELLKNGLAVPMMGYFDDAATRADYEKATEWAFKSKIGIWAIPEINDRYNNIISDKTITEINLLAYLPEKKSALNRYLVQSPTAKIIRAALNRKKKNEAGRKSAEEIFKLITKDLSLVDYNIDIYKVLCDRYVEEIENFERQSVDPDAVKDVILHIEEMIDELALGDGPIKGNFGKGVNRLIYHEDPNDRWYQLCIPEISFRSVGDAKFCGFKKKT